jgi:hypothetical protein
VEEYQTKWQIFGKFDAILASTFLKAWKAGKYLWILITAEVHRHSKNLGITSKFHVPEG